MHGSVSDGSLIIILICELYSRLIINYMETGMQDSLNKIATECHNKWTSWPNIWNILDVYCEANTALMTYLSEHRGTSSAYLYGLFCVSWRNIYNPDLIHSRKTILCISGSVHFFFEMCANCGLTRVKTKFGENCKRMICNTVFKLIIN